ncbi:hypothetical protein Ciccas_009227 [Cichlidogyrus casuarinus]|uniref:DUF5725 domain-containing protein n=1 Tax=Cichlidogyrus casuarinus TaxID=1844966 RepID=A0ABD2PXN5_9PLAT
MVPRNILSSVGSQEQGENGTVDSSQSSEENQQLSFDRNGIMANLHNRWQQYRKSSFEDTSFHLANLIQNKMKNGLSINAMNEVFQRKLAFKREHSEMARPRRMNEFSKKSFSPTISQPPARNSNLCERPAVILNPAEPREMFVGGVHTVKLPVWAYRKCLGMVRGAPHELGPRLCLRLLQSLFSLNYLVTHNYNGSGGKTPIDPTVMGAVLQQAQLQFGSDHFFTEPMALGKLRDYLNNAFRVMAFRQRKGERVRSPFWNEQGEPVLPLDPPLGYNMNNSVTGCIKDLNSAPTFYRNHQAEVNSSSVDS